MRGGGALIHLHLAFQREDFPQRGSFGCGGGFHGYLRFYAGGDGGAVLSARARLCASDEKPGGSVIFRGGDATSGVFLPDGYGGNVSADAPPSSGGDGGGG